MAKADLVSLFAKKTELGGKQAVETFNAISAAIKSELSVGRTISIPHFGTFRAKTRKARLGRNPKTGAPIQIPSKKTIWFSPSTALREKINAKISREAANAILENAKREAEAIIKERVANRVADEEFSSLHHGSKPAEMTADAAVPEAPLSVTERAIFEEKSSKKKPKPPAEAETASRGDSIIAETTFRISEKIRNAVAGNPAPLTEEKPLQPNPTEEKPDNGWKSINLLLPVFVVTGVLVILLAILFFLVPTKKSEPDTAMAPHEPALTEIQDSAAPPTTDTLAGESVQAEMYGRNTKTTEKLPDSYAFSAVRTNSAAVSAGGDPCGERLANVEKKVSEQEKILAKQQELLRHIAIVSNYASQPNRKPACGQRICYMTYTVKKGDTLSKIAQKFTSNRYNWTGIYRLNRNTITNANAIKPGQKILIGYTK